jgi:hypothetical protein
MAFHGRHPGVDTMTTKTVTLHALAGAALGLCVGILIGMTTAPVVGTVVGALAALFATVFGVRLQDVAAFARIGGFGAFCVLGVLIGVALRTHNVLGISVTQQVNEWVAAGYDKATARQIVIYRELGLLSDKSGVLAPTSRAEKVGPSAASGHLSARGEDECNQMAPENFANDPDKIIRSYRNSGGAWEILAQSLVGLPPEKQRSIAEASWRLACPTR